MSDAQSPDFTGPCPSCGGPVPDAESRGQRPGSTSLTDGKTRVCDRCVRTELLMVSMSGMKPPEFEDRMKMFTYDPETDVFTKLSEEEIAAYREALERELLEKLAQHLNR